MSSPVMKLKVVGGTTMPVVGIGSWKVTSEQMDGTLRTAIEAGYRLVDCGWNYGNEQHVGSVLKAILAEGKVKREDIFVISKLWNTKHTPKDVRPVLIDSLNKLGLEYLDLYLMHFPHAFKSGDVVLPKDENGKVLYDDIHYLQTWRAMEKCVEEGLVKSLGVSNFNHKQIQDLLDNATIKPVNLQVEIHPWFSQEKLVQFCQSKGVSVTAFSPFGSPDRPWAPEVEETLLECLTIKAIADKYHKSPAQVILRWLLQRGVAVIPKSTTPSRIQENIQVFDFEVEAADMLTLSGLNKNCRFMVPMEQVDGQELYRDRKAPYFPWNIEY